MSRGLRHCETIMPKTFIVLLGRKVATIVDELPVVRSERILSHGEKFPFPVSYIYCTVGALGGFKHRPKVPVARDPPRVSAIRERSLRLPVALCFGVAERIRC